MSINPLDGKAPFIFEGMNPNCSFSKTKDGPKYRVSFEVTKDDWQQFVDTDTAGMIIELQGLVTHRNTPEVDNKSAKVDKQAQNGSQTVTKQSEKTPYGALIAKLHTGGLFMCPAVWRALGGSKSYEKWSQLQPCIVCGDMDYVEVTPGEGLVGRCEFSHIKTAANSGTGIKPEFSGNPMCNKHHSLQHNSGEIAVYQEYVMRTVGGIDEGEDIKIVAMSWLEKQNAENIVKWAHAKLAVIMKVEKLSECHPKYIYAWAVKNKLLRYLPADFRTDEIINNAKNM